MRVFTLASPPCPSAVVSRLLCSLVLPAGSSMNNHAPCVPAPAAPAGPALSHGITEEERSARMCHTRAQSLPSRLHTLLVSGHVSPGPVSRLRLSSVYMSSRRSHSNRRTNVTFSPQPVKRAAVCSRARARALPITSVSQLYDCTSSRLAQFSFTFQCIYVHDVSRSRTHTSPRLESTFDGTTRAFAHTVRVASPLLFSPDYFRGVATRTCSTDRSASLPIDVSSWPTPHRRALSRVAREPLLRLRVRHQYGEHESE